MRIKIFRYLFIFCITYLFLLLIFPSNTLAQTVKSTNDKILVGRFDFSPWVEYEELSQYNESISDAFNLYQINQGNFAINLCSNQPFAKSILTGIINPSRIIFDLTNKPKVAKISNDNLVIVNSSCQKSRLGGTAVELWWLKNVNTFTNAETIKPCQIKYLIDKDGVEFNSDNEYREFLNLIVKESRVSLKPIKIAAEISSIYYKEPSVSIKKRFRLAKKLLANEIRDGIVTIRFHKKTFPDGKLIKRNEPKFPSIKMLQILENCNPT